MHPWWRAKVVSNNPDAVGTPADLSLTNMVRTFLSVSDGNDQPDLILCGVATWHEYYKAVENKVGVNYCSW